MVSGSGACSRMRYVVRCECSIGRLSGADPVERQALG